MSSLTQVCHGNLRLTTIKRSVGILSKIRYYVDINVLSNLYYALIYPFLTYEIIGRGNTYSTTLQPFFILQKKAIRLMTFTSFHENSSPIFRKLNIIKLDDLMLYHIAVFMYIFNNFLLPSGFDALFSNVSEIHHYKHDLQLNSHNTFPKLELIMENLILEFKDQRSGTQLMIRLKLFKTTTSFAVLILPIILYFVTSILLFRACICVYLCVCVYTVWYAAILYPAQ